MEENFQSAQPASKRNVPRDVFLHLLAIVTLYWSAVSFITLLWQTINHFLPDVLNYYPASIIEPMRFAVASLIIVFPVFLITSWYLNKIYRRESIVRESKIRKWLIYLTLFIASITVIVDLVMVVLNLLSGDATLKFILKALSVLVVAVIIFGYYLDDVRKETPAKSAKYYAWISVVIVLIGVVSAFFIVGSPATARLMQFDQQKVSDLQNIQYQIVNYWQRKESLPSSLSVLNDPISEFKVPVDPQTNQPYEYNIIDAANLSFELCATFNKEGTDLYGQAPSLVYNYAPTKGYMENWQHAAGRVCFERTIDKQLYPVKQNP